jgi:hypothetical protein
MAVCLRPALLKCDVGTFAPDAILDGHLPIILGVVFGLVFEYFLARFSSTMEPGRMDISSFWTHRDWTRETHF